MLKNIDMKKIIVSLYYPFIIWKCSNGKSSLANLVNDGIHRATANFTLALHKFIKLKYFICLLFWSGRLFINFFFVLKLFSRVVHFYKVGRLWKHPWRNSWKNLSQKFLSIFFPVKKIVNVLSWAAFTTYYCSRKTKWWCNLKHCHSCLTWSFSSYIYSYIFLLFSRP